MSERADVMPTPEGEYIEKNRFAPLSFLFAIVGLVGLGLSVVGGFVSPHQFSFSWLFAFAFYFTMLAGCFFWIIVHHVVDASWSVVVRRQLENLAMLLVRGVGEKDQDRFFLINAREVKEVGVLDEPQGAVGVRRENVVGVDDGERASLHEGFDAGAVFGEERGIDRCVAH